MEKLIHAACFTLTAKGWGLPLLLWGPSGVGKSEITEAAPARWGLPVVPLSPAEHGDGAFGDVPVPRPDSAVLDYPAPGYVLDVFQPAGGGVLFLDEATNADPGIQRYVQGIARARRIGSCDLGPTVRVIAAANPPDIATGGHALSLPMRRRFVHLEWRTDDDGFLDWLTSADHAASVQDTIVDPQLARAEEARVLALWPAAYARAAALVRAFLSSRRDLIRVEPTSGATEQGSPCPRTWEYVTCALAGADVHGLSAEDRFALVVGAVGKAAGMRCLEFIARADLPDPADVLAGRVQWQWDPQRPDAGQATLQSCAAYARASQRDRQARADALWSMLGALAAAGVGDVAFLIGRDLVKHDLHRSPAGLAALGALRPMFAAAGVSL